MISQSFPSFSVMIHTNIFKAELYSDGGWISWATEHSRWVPDVTFVSYDTLNCWKNHAEFHNQQFSIKVREAFIWEMSTGIACSTYFQLLSGWYRPLKVSSLCLLLLPHYTSHTHTHSHSRLGGWEDGYAPEWQPYHWVFSLRGQWAPVPGKASFFSTYLCMSFHCDTISDKNTVYKRDF